MAEIRDNKLPRLSAKTAKLVAPAFVPDLDRSTPVTPRRESPPAGDALRSLTSARATLARAASTAEPVLAESRAHGVATTGTLVPRPRITALPADEVLFESVSGTQAIARKFMDLEPIPAAVFTQPAAMIKAVKKLLQDGVLSFVDGFQEAYANLTPEQKAKYDEIARALGDDPAARRALALLLVSGALDTKDLQGGATLLDHLHTLATGPIAEGLDRRKLLSDVVRDIADPSQISQGNYNTCAAATAQRLLAGQSPAEYARLMAGLASPSGEVRLANGDLLVRPADWNQSTGDGRDLAGRLFQSSMMAYAAGKAGETYSNATDTRTKANGQKVKGLSAAEVVYLFEGILGKDYTKYGVSDIGADKLMQKIKDVVAGGGVVPCAITLNGKHHEVLVTKIENGRVHYFDPKTGQTRTMSEEEFKSALYNANIPNQAVLSFRQDALANFAKLGQRSIGPGGFPLPFPTGNGNDPRSPSGFFGFGGLANLVKLLILMGVADDEIGDGSGSGNQTGDKRAGGTPPSSSSTSSKTGRGGKKTGSSTGG